MNHAWPSGVICKPVGRWPSLASIPVGFTSGGNLNSTTTSCRSKSPASMVMVCSAETARKLASKKPKADFMRGSVGKFALEEKRKREQLPKTKQMPAMPRDEREHPRQRRHVEPLERGPLPRV